MKTIETSSRPIVGRLIVAAVTALLLGLPEPGGAQEVPGLQILTAAQDAMADAIARSEKSVVSIARVVKRRDAPATPAFSLRGNRFGNLFPLDPPRDPRDPDFIPNEFSTGVVIGAEGLILTNYHTLDLEQQNVYWVTTTGRKVYRAKVRAADPRYDLAVLELPELGSGRLTPITMGSSAKLKKGHFVISLGNPYAIARDGQVSASWGIVSNFGRKAAPKPTAGDQIGKSTLHHYGTLIQTDAKLNLGTSGGALLNLKGEMVGLTTALAAHSGYDQSAGYAIAVDETFLRVVERLKKAKEVEFGLLGIQPENLSEDRIRRGEEGAFVRTVYSGTPASKSGLRNGDIIKAVGRTPVRDADSLVLNIGRLSVGSLTRLTVQRGGQLVHVDVELAKFPVKGKKIFTPPPAWRGMRVDYSSVLSLRRREGLALLEDSVVVIEVETGSLAWKSGLRSGDIITHVDNLRVGAPRKFLEAVEGKTGNVQVRLGGAAAFDNPLRTIKARDDS